MKPNKNQPPREQPVSPPPAPAVTPPPAAEPRSVAVVAPTATPETSPHDIKVTALKETQAAHAKSLDAASSLTVGPDRITFKEPVILLNGYVMLSGTKQERELRPEVAFVAEGVLVIEELGLVFPMSAVQVIRRKVTR
jgi:hypothetical protein